MISPNGSMYRVNSSGVPSLVIDKNLRHQQDIHLLLQTDNDHDKYDLNHASAIPQMPT